MSKKIHGSMSGAADALRREAAALASSPHAAQAAIIGSEDMAPLAIQLAFTACQKNGAQLLGQHLEISGNIGFTGSITHLVWHFVSASGGEAPSAVPPGCLAHYIDWFGRHNHAKSRLNGPVFQLLVDAIVARNAQTIGDPGLKKNATIAFRQLAQHNRLDHSARIQMIQEALNDRQALLSLADFFKQVIIVTGPRTTAQEIAFFRELIKEVKDYTWISCADTPESSDFTPLTEGAASIEPVGSMYAAIKAYRRDASEGLDAVYLHENHIGTFSQLFGLAICMVGASISLLNSIEWYTLLRGMLNLPHEDSVAQVKHLAEYHAKQRPVDGVNQILGSNHVIGRTFSLCYHNADQPETAYRHAVQAVKELLESRGMEFTGETKIIVEDINRYYRWMSRSCSSVSEFYLMTCLYPYSGRFPKNKIYTINKGIK